MLVVFDLRLPFNILRFQRFSYPLKPQTYPNLSSNILDRQLLLCSIHFAPETSNSG